MRHTIVGLLLFVLAACAQPVSKEQLGQIKTVGVISAIGEDLNFTTVGFTVFGNDFKQASIGSWGIDDYVVAQVGEALRSRYDVRPVTYRRSAFTSQNMDTPVGWQGPFDKRRTIQEVIRTEAQPQGLDAYVVVTDFGSQFGTTNQGVRGVGLVKGGGLGTSRVGLHVLYRVIVVSGHDQKVVGQARAETLPGSESSVFLRGPSREVGMNLWADGMQAMPASKQDEVKAGLRSLISRSLPPTLQSVGLLN
jgi:hypothetical protein